MIIFLWNIFLKEKNMENIIYKVELENILRNKLNYNSGHYLKINSNTIQKLKVFKTFFDKYII